VHGSQVGEVALDHGVAVADAAAERELWPGAGDLLPASFAPFAGEVAASLVEVQRIPAGVQAQEREAAGILLARGDLLVRDAGCDRADGALVAVGVPGMMQEQSGVAGVVLQDGRRLRCVERADRRDGERRILDFPDPRDPAQWEL
jgi:hypothetical protein